MPTMLTSNTGQGILNYPDTLCVSVNAGITRDALSGVYCPATVAEWAAALALAADTQGGPSAIWTCQDPSGNLADARGLFPLIASGVGVTYAQPVSGWSRLGLLFNDGTSGAFTSTDAGLPDISTTSIAVLWYFLATVSGANRMLTGVGTTTNLSTLVQSTGVARCISGANIATGIAAQRNVVRPWLLTHNKTGSSDVLYTDAEKVVPTFSALTTGKTIGLGQFAGTLHAPGTAVYGSAFFGAAAERTSTQWKTLLTTLGWSPLFV